MKLTKIYEVLSAPMLIAPSAHASITNLLKQHAKLTAAQFKAEREGADFCGGDIDIPQAELIDGIGYIPVGGPIGMDLGKFEKGAGCVDVDDIEDELTMFDADPECKAVLMLFDSPGGMVSGTFELCEKIRAFEKPIYAFTRGQMCSAAYALGCATDGLFATKTADVGSIGVFLAIPDTSEMYAKEGIKIEKFASGKFKGAGCPGTSLTDAQKEMLQARVMQINTMFRDHVLACRGEVDDETMQGQSFLASEASERNLIDEIVPDLESVVSKIKR